MPSRLGREGPRRGRLCVNQEERKGDKPVGGEALREGSQGGEVGREAPRPREMEGDKSPGDNGAPGST